MRRRSSARLLSIPGSTIQQPGFAAKLFDLVPLMLNSLLLLCSLAGTMNQLPFEVAQLSFLALALSFLAGRMLGVSADPFLQLYQSPLLFFPVNNVVVNPPLQARANQMTAVLA